MTSPSSGRRGLASACCLLPLPLPLPLPLLFLLLLLAPASALLYRQVALRDVVLEQNMVFQSSARSIFDCARQCAGSDTCMTFTVVPEGSRWSCRGHFNDVSLPGVSSSASAGAITYRLDDDVTSGVNDVTTCPSPDANWLKRACSSTADCLHCSLANVECYKNLCLCTPGYYYSLGQNNCVSSCTNMAASFTKYPNSGIAGNNDLKMSDTHPDVSLPACASDPLCLSVDYYYEADRQDSFLQTVTAMDVPADWEFVKPGVDYYNRDCQ